MQGYSNRSFSNPPLRELNSINMTQKMTANLVSPKESSIPTKLRPTKECDTSYEITEKKLGGIEGDRAALIYRINKLQQEVDNLNKENSELHSKIHHEKARFEDFQKKFSHTTKVKSLVDRNYQGDIKYEREENSRLKHILHNLEKERNELRSKFKETENVISGIHHEKQEVLTRLQQKTDHVSIIEGDNRILVDKLSLLQNKLYIFEKENYQIIQENEHLKEILTVLESQHEDMRDKIQEECSKYNNLVTAKRDELENLKWAFKRQLKVIAAKNSAIELEKITQVRKQNAFYSIKMFIENGNTRIWGAKKLIANVFMFNYRKMQKSFRIMSAGLSWADTNKINQNLAEKLYVKSRLLKIIKEWRRITETEASKYSGKIKSIRSMLKILTNSHKLKTKKRFTRWHRNTNFLDARNKVILKLISHNTVESMRLVMHKWNSYSKKTRYLQAIEDLSVDFAATCFQAKFFYALKEYVKLKKLEYKTKGLKVDQAQKLYKISILNELRRCTLGQKRKKLYLKKILSNSAIKDLNRAFQTWKSETNNDKNMSKVNKLLTYSSAKDQKLFLKIIFYSWKDYKNKILQKKTVEKLHSEGDARLHYQEQLASLSSDHSRNLQINALKCIINPLYRGLQNNFSHWKKVTNHFKSSLPAVKNLIFKHYHLQIFCAFNAWKLKKSNFEYSALYYKNEKMLKEKIELHQTVLMLEEVLANKLTSIETIKYNRVKRCILLMKNRDIIAAMRKWSKRSFVLTSKSQGTRSLGACLSKIVYKRSFYSIHAFAKANKEKIIRKRRLAKTFIARTKDSLSLTFDGWKNFTRTMKNFRKVLGLAVSRKDLTNITTAINYWKEFINTDEIFRLNREAALLNKQKNDLENELLGVSQNLNNEKHFNSKLESVLKQKGKKRLLLSFFKGSQYKIQRAWNSWIEFSKLHALMLKKTTRIVKCWSNKELRMAWRNWNLFVKLQLQKFASIQIDLQKKDKKKLQAESKKASKDYEQRISDQESAFSSLSTDFKKIQKLSKFLLSRGTRQTSEEYSISKSAYFFKVMKQRYYNLKSALTSLTKNLRQLSIRRGLRDIKTHYLESMKIASFRIMLITVFKRCGGKLLRNEFDRWYRNIWYCHERKLQKEIKESSIQLSEAASHKEIVKNRNKTKACKILIGKTKSVIFQAWRNVANKGKKLSFASTTLKKQIVSNKLILSLDLLRQNAKQNALSKQHMKKTDKFSTTKILKSSFLSWKFFYSSHKTLAKSLRKISHIYEILSKTYSFSSIKHTASLNSITFSWLSRSKSSAIKHLFLSESKRFLNKYLNKWKSSHSYRGRSQKLLKKAILRALHRKLRSGFDNWNEDILLKDTVDITNTQGPVAIENGILKGRIEILNKLMEEEGLDMRYVEKYILSKENQQSALALRNIHIFKYKKGLINPNDCSIIPKFFIIWKQWVLKRKRISKTSFRILAYLRKPQLMRGFLKWKHGLSLIINTVNKLPRRDLFSLIAKLDLDIRILESKLESTHKSLLYYETYSQLLACQVRRGQNMALVTCSLQTHKALYQALLRWSYHTGLCKVHELLEQLTSTEQNLYIYKTTLKNMEDDNQILVEENMELRQASLDGVAIAEAFETLSKERERLSMDLAERTATIKRLIDQNNELAERLRNAGFDDAPEKEYGKAKLYN